MQQSASNIEDDSLVAGPGRQDRLLAGDGLRGLVQRVEGDVREGGGPGPAPQSCRESGGECKIYTFVRNFDYSLEKKVITVF